MSKDDDHRVPKSLTLGFPWNPSFAASAPVIQQ